MWSHSDISLQSQCRPAWQDSVHKQVDDGRNPHREYDLYSFQPDGADQPVLLVVPSIKIKHHSAQLNSPAQISRQSKTSRASVSLGDDWIEPLWVTMRSDLLSCWWDDWAPPGPPSGVYAGQCLYFTVSPAWQVPSLANRLSVNHKTHWTTKDLIYWRMFSTQSKSSPVSKTTQLLIAPQLVLVVACFPSPHQILCFRLILSRPPQTQQPSVRATNLMATSNLVIFH